MSIKIHLLNIIKIMKKVCKKKLVKDIQIFLKKKKKKQIYGCEQNKNLPEDEKQKLVVYRKKMLQNEKKHLTIIIINYFHL